jgi:hypothetical protein
MQEMDRFYTPHKAIQLGHLEPDRSDILEAHLGLDLGMEIISSDTGINHPIWEKDPGPNNFFSFYNISDLNNNLTSSLNTKK